MNEHKATNRPKFYQIEKICQNVSYMGKIVVSKFISYKNKFEVKFS